MSTRNAEIEAGLVRLQVLLGQLMEREYKQGWMTREQYEFILDWMAHLPEMDVEEAKAQLEAWFAWRDETHPAWRWERKSKQPP